MKRILVTGATGNVGTEVVRALGTRGGVEIRAAVRNGADLRRFAEVPGVTTAQFDFNDEATFDTALEGCESLFLLRPPQIADAFDMFIDRAKRAGVGHIVFLSVQGAQKSRFIPHHRTEKLLKACGVPYTFLRPAYFMQNFTTTLQGDLVEHHRIFLPAGNACFTLIDVRDIGDVAAIVLAAKGTEHHNKPYTLTARERLTFRQMADLLSAGLGVPIRYVSPSPWRFFVTKRREGIKTSFILIMLMLHYLPRFTAAPPTTETVYALTGRQPIEFAEFVADNTVALR